MITLKNLNKVYDDNHYAVKDLNLDIEDQEFVVFVGPSGCGKSTTLRMIAGLEEISQGEIYVDGQLLNQVPPKDRGIAMVFQNYALYPHMSVYKNLAFGLKMRGIHRKHYHERILDAAKTLEISHLLDRKPKALSGGQRQRVALGRAIVREAKIFLMDEPLSNLDAKLRTHMRTEIIKLHKAMGATTIYVTHDQTEAMTMATKIVLLKDGVIQQVGTPEDIYHHPVNQFVATFIGTPTMNMIPISKVNHDWQFRGQTVMCPNTLPTSYTNLNIGVRAEHLQYATEMDALQSCAIRLQDWQVTLVELIGATKLIYCQHEDVQVVVSTENASTIQSGQRIHLGINWETCHFFNSDTGEVVLAQHASRSKVINI
ncbi:spermidine/putrescine ABC transporter ATP-binding protein [Staphylococcus felis]|uniref:ABC transporter ATP-binding protein n=1 Tax=Staphylococcus felis TaxID=46127 RepID=UPI000E2615A5|nr:sn-glycerol-3-phosphate ABC transporter ATP-binding protein UgpC [Staphylococcus felis]REI02405.1 spermidine/putrescine ABC transporter ATP-binding protein [Staphylococcus felis]REI13178.1 spermidine/putrescine ABC transporter ATP-binding protein [Staphylococcus felis]REI25024.1 spermidine/putrescine ABC transporter ATP-binding protein [Staphylococcus felis]